MIKIVLRTMTENTLLDISYNTITDQRREDRRKIKNPHEYVRSQ